MEYAQHVKTDERVNKKAKVGSLRHGSKAAKRWSAVSDGGEDQGAEEEALMGQKKAKNHHCQFWKEPSRASGSSFQRGVVRHAGYFFTACSGPSATLVHSMILDLRPGTNFVQCVWDVRVLPNKEHGKGPCLTSLMNLTAWFFIVRFVSSFHGERGGIDASTPRTHVARSVRCGRAGQGGAGRGRAG